MAPGARKCLSLELHFCLISREVQQTLQTARETKGKGKEDKEGKRGEKVLTFFIPYMDCNLLWLDGSNIVFRKKYFFEFFVCFSYMVKFIQIRHLIAYAVGL